MHSEDDLMGMLTNFTTREDLVSFIRTLPDDARGVLCFIVPSDETDEEGGAMELYKYKSYGSINTAEAVLLGLEIMDFARGKE